MIEMDYRRTLLQTHTEIPVHQIRPVIVPLLIQKSHLTVPHFLHIQRDLGGPTRHKFTHIVPILKFQQPQIHKFLQRSIDYFLVMDKI